MITVQEACDNLVKFKEEQEGERMKLWLLRRVDMAFGDYDAWYGFVVRAKSEEDARNLASKNCGGNECNGYWKDPVLSICEELLPDGDPGVIIEDFHAG